MRASSRPGKRECLLLTGLYAITCVALAIHWTGLGDWYQLFQTLANGLAAGAFWALCRLARLKEAWRFKALVLAFVYLSYTLGVAARLYHALPGYDKIMHGLSGAFTMILALPLFYLLKGNDAIVSGDKPLALAFCLSCTLAVAGLWEITEYFLNALTGIDLQNVAATGVGDTMTDMLVCLAGALALIPGLDRLYKKGPGPLTGAALEPLNTLMALR